MHDERKSRFIRRTDPRCNRVLIPPPRTWWSRAYEYYWAQSFAASCGSADAQSHPFKFWLETRCRETVACDIDPHIQHDDLVAAEIERDLGIADPGKLLDADRPSIRLMEASMLHCRFRMRPSTGFSAFRCRSIFPPTIRTQRCRCFAARSCLEASSP